MGDGNKVEFLVAVCALIASAMAVFMAWDQSRVMRAQQHGAVFPVLQVDGYATNTEMTSALGIRVRNSGVGPALIESVTLSIDGDATNGFGDFPDRLPAGYELSWTRITGRALAPNETVDPVHIAWEQSSDSRQTLQMMSQEAERWALEICYCSVFGRCWQTRSLGQSRAERVERCERQESDIFEALGNRDLPIASPSDQAIQTDTNIEREPSE